MASSTPSTKSTEVESKPTYNVILKSSSIVGGSKVLEYVIRLISIKAVAVLLGPAGIGLIGLYNSMIALVSTLAGMGIDKSGVRDVAQAYGTEDPIRIATTVKTLRRSCWVTGAIGCAITMALAYPLSLWTFETGERAWSIAFLGLTVLIGTVSAGQMAFLQGTRRIADIARVNVLSATAGTTIAIAVYYVFGQQGIVPVLILSSVLNLFFSWYFSRRIPVAAIELGWRETCKNSISLLSLGLAFMWGALLTSVVALVIRAIIVRDLGLDSAGVYTAAWSVSGMFAVFVLNAMSSDFYPRLTAVAHDNDQMNKLVNEQMEIGVLLGLPGLTATLSFAPLIMRLLFTEKFLPGAELLPWFVLGVMMQLMGFPLGYVQRAKGATRWIFLSTTESSSVLLVLSLVLLYFCGLLGIALAVPCMYLIHVTVQILIARHLTGFRYSAESIRVQLSYIAVILLAFGIQQSLSGSIALVLGGVITAFASVFCLRGIKNRIGQSHRLIRLICKFPGGRLACGI